MTDPIQPEMHNFLNAMAKGLDIMFNGQDCPPDKKKTGFFLFAFDYNDGPEQGRMNYISNSNRADVLVSLKEMVAQLEGRVHTHNTEQ